MPTKLEIFYKLIAAVWVGFFIYLVCITYARGPHLDDWDILYFVKAIDDGTFRLNLLYEKLTGVHIPAVARLLFSIEYFVFKGQNIFSNIICFLSLCGSFYLFSKNIKLLNIAKSDKNLLVFSGIFFIFSGAQLLSFNFTWGSFQPTPSVFLSLLAIHMFSCDIRNQKIIGAPQIAIYIITGTLSALFIPLGLFALIAILIGLIVYRAPIGSILIHAAGLALLIYIFRPEELIFRSGDLVYVLSKHDFYQYAKIDPAPFFPYFFGYLLGYFGGIIRAISATAAISIGVPIAILLAITTIFLFIKRNKHWIFFQITLFTMLGLAVTTALGRYELGITTMDRLYPVYCWLLWVLCVVTIILWRKLGITACIILLVISAAMNGIHVRDYLIRKHQISQAEINIINNSFPHMVHYKISTSLRMFGFNPGYFHDYLKEKKWGIYTFPFDVDLTKVNNDACESIKTKEFIVSNKKFVEYQLDGWNLTKNKHMDYIYALDKNNNPVAYGITMPRKPSLLPLFATTREKTMVYLIAPREYTLRELRLLGGDGDTLCEIVQRK